MDFKNIFNLPVFIALAAILLALAIIVGPRGDTLDKAKALLDAENERALVKNNYMAHMHDTELAKFLPQILNSIDSRYFIRYPNDWVHSTAGQTTILNGKEGTPAYYTSINIQTIRSHKFGGIYANVAQFVTDLKILFAQNFSNVKFLEEGPITLRQPNGGQVHGEYLIFTYSNHGLPFKQWQVIVMRSDGIAFYVWTFTSPLVHYENNLSIAENILKSWDIY